jgi:hypothetical protein
VVAKKRQEEQARTEMERRRKEAAAAVAEAAAAAAVRKREEEQVSQTRGAIPCCPADWNVDETAAFFQRLSFVGAASVVLEQGVDGKTMLALTDDELKEELGLRNLQVKRFHLEIEAMLRCTR